MMNSINKFNQLLVFTSINNKIQIIILWMLLVHLRLLILLQLH
jgi:hypothetical protein